MFKKVAILMFLSVVSLATVTASAAIKEPHHVVSTLVIANAVSHVVDNKNTSKLDQVQYSISEGKSKNESTLPTSGWLLLSALIGFVLLSNRWSV